MKIKTKATIIFLLCFSIFPCLASTSAQSTLSLTLSTNKQIYYTPCSVGVAGVLQDNGKAVNDGLVGLQIQDSSGVVIVSRTIMTGTTAPNYLSAQITSASMSDMSGNPQNEIQPGTLGYFAFSFVNNNQNSMLITINIFDSSGMPIGVIYGKPTKSGTAILSIQIPSWAHAGTAYGYANMYSDWPSNGGTPIAQEQAFQFTISGNPTASSNPPTSYGNQGAYSFSFTFPQGVMDGAYSVFASSTYLGQTALQNASFSNSLPGDFNGDRKVDFNDFAIFVTSYTLYNHSSSNYNHMCDMNKDGKVDWNDFFTFTLDYGVSVPA